MEKDYRELFRQAQVELEEWRTELSASTPIEAGDRVSQRIRRLEQERDDLRSQLENENSFLSDYLRKLKKTIDGTDQALRLEALVEGVLAALDEIEIRLAKIERVLTRRSS